MKRITPSHRVSRLLIVLALTLLIRVCHSNQLSGSAVPIEIAWSTSLINTGQLVAVLKHTKIANNFAIEPAFKGMDSNESVQNFLTAEKTDAVILSDLEAVMLLAADTSWTILARVAWETATSHPVPDSTERVPRMALLLGRHTFMARTPAGVVDLLAALMDAGLYRARHADLAGQWYSLENFRATGPEELRNSADVDPNHRAMMKGHISMNLPAGDLAKLQELIVLFVQNGTIHQPYQINTRTDLSNLRRAEEKWWKIPDNELE
ncbi:MAG: hypothetical protein NTW14_00285 [bacterium]|nr:hypothetical protein [bacterium]